MEEESANPSEEKDDDVSVMPEDESPAFTWRSFLLSLCVLLGVTLTISLAILPVAIDFSKKVPDRYMCSSGDECNHFEVDVKHWGILKIMVRGTGTNLNCNVRRTVGKHEHTKSQEQIDARKCARHWKYSQDVHFYDYSKFMNGCINSVAKLNHEQCRCLETGFKKNRDFTKGQLALFGGLLRTGQFEQYRIGTMSSYNTHKKVYDYAVQNKLFDLCNVTIDIKERQKTRAQNTDQDTHNDNAHTNDHH